MLTQVKRQKSVPRKAPPRTDVAPALKPVAAGVRKKRKGVLNKLTTNNQTRNIAFQHQRILIPLNARLQTIAPGTTFSTTAANVLAELYRDLIVEMTDRVLDVHAQSLRRVLQANTTFAALRTLLPPALYSRCAQRAITALAKKHGTEKQLDHFNAACAPIGKPFAA